ncbi:MAG: caspase family protein [Alphaproteobacteria bacterium]|nr:caspase family protein [Alphaproteobacteria bacterium]
MAALAFADARCNGPDNPVDPGCGLLVAGASGAGFSYLRLYDWRRGRVLAAAEVLHGRLTRLAAAPGGAEIAACTATGAIRRFRPDGSGGILIRPASAAETRLAAPTSRGCNWIGYGPDGALRIATATELLVLPESNAAAEKGAEAAAQAMPARAPFAFAPKTAAFALAVGEARRITLYPDGPATPQSHRPRRIATGSRFGRAGAQALAWVDDGETRYLLAIGPFGDGDSAIAGAVTHRIERWRMPDRLKAATARLYGSNFNELLALQGQALALLPLTAAWKAIGDPDRHRYVAVLDSAHRLVLVAGHSGYTKTADGKRMADPAFVLAPRPYAQGALQVSDDGRNACFWPGGDAGPVAFHPVSENPTPCPPPAQAAAIVAPMHGPDGLVTLAPATRPLRDFAGERLRAYTVSADGHTLFAAVAREGSSQTVDLRRYTLHGDRWAPAGEPAPAASDVVALGLSGGSTLGVVTRGDGTTGAPYRIEVRAVDPSDAQPALVLQGFVPSATDTAAFTLCFDVRDPSTPLALSQRQGPRIRLGPAERHPNGPGDASADRSTYAPGVTAEVLESAADPSCTAAALKPGMRRFRMKIRLPFAVTGAFDLVPEGGRTEYQILDFSRPNLYVLAVGIDDYYDRRWHLNYAAADAAAFAGLVRKTQTQLYRDVETVVILDGQANRKAILVELAKLRRKAKPQDWVMIFFAGHAKSDWMYNYYFLPWDYDHTYPHATQVSEYDLGAHLRAIAGKKVLVMDTCFAGNLATAPIRGVSDDNRPRRLPLRDVRAYAERLMQADPGLILFAASSEDQTARESDRLGHGVFTSVLLEALQSPEHFANRRNAGALTALDIREWVEAQVVRQSRDRQKPVIVGRADLMRAPFWQVSPVGGRDPGLAQNGASGGNKRGGGTGAALGRVLWRAIGQAVPSF